MSLLRMSCGPTGMRTHGYFTDADKDKRRPSRYLWMVDGNVPDSITSLPALWLLAYLVDQTFVGWNPLPIGIAD